MSNSLHQHPSRHVPEDWELNFFWGGGVGGHPHYFRPEDGFKHFAVNCLKQLLIKVYQTLFIVTLFIRLGTPSAPLRVPQISCLLFVSFCIVVLVSAP